MRLIVCLLVLTMVGCAAVGEVGYNETYPGAIHTSTSEFDSRTEIVMNPAYIYTDSSNGEYSSILLGVMWSDQNSNPYVLRVDLPSPNIFDRNEDLKLVVGGKNYSLQPVDANSVGDSISKTLRLDLDGQSLFAGTTHVVRKAFRVRREVLEDMVDSGRVIGRVQTTQGYVDFSLYDKPPKSKEIYEDFQIFNAKLPLFLDAVDEFNVRGSSSQ